MELFSQDLPTYLFAIAQRNVFVIPPSGHGQFRQVIDRARRVRERIHRSQALSKPSAKPQVSTVWI